MKTKIYYSIQSGGDGSAYPTFMESAELASLDQEITQIITGEGWAEDCSGYVEVESDSIVTVLNVVTAKEYLKEVEDDMEYMDPNQLEALSPFLDQVRRLA